MTKLNNTLKFLLKIILYIAIILFTLLTIMALYQIYIKNINKLYNFLSMFFLIFISTFVLLLICKQLKKVLIFSRGKIRFPEKIFGNKDSLFIKKMENTLEFILKITFTIIPYIFILFLSIVIIVILSDFSVKNQETFPLEVAQFLIVTAFITILIMLYKDLKKLYAYLSVKIKYLRYLSENTVAIGQKIKEKILIIRLDFLKKIILKIKKLLEFISDKVEIVVKILENKINYPSKIEFKERYNFFESWKKIEKFAEVFYQILMYLTVASSCFIFIPLLTIVSYKIIIFLIAVGLGILEIIFSIF